MHGICGECETGCAIACQYVVPISFTRQKLAWFLSVLAPKPAMTRDEVRALKQSRNNRSQVILRADKGWQWWCYKQDYINKALDLVGQSETYRTLSADPNYKCKGIHQHAKDHKS